jgi:hypothetical protein
VCCWPASGSVENMAGDRVPGGHWRGRGSSEMRGGGLGTGEGHLEQG